MSNEHLTGHIHFSPNDTPDSEIYLRSKIPAEYQDEYADILHDYQRNLRDIEKTLVEAQMKHDHDAEQARFDYNERIARMWRKIDASDSEKGQGG